jgi:hypothetical protein
MRQERQKHGLKFEDWLKKSFFDIYYTSEWDIPSQLNPIKNGGPISIKTAKWRGSVDFGDALRQFDINHNFTLIVGFWVPCRGKKKVVKITENTIKKRQWHSYWGELKRIDLKKLDDTIKNRKQNYKTAREKAQEIKSKIQPQSKIITLNPKIDSKTQRRLQCSISFKEFFKHIVGTKNPAEDKEFVVWKTKVEPPLL